MFDKVTYITSNPGKAEQMSRLLGFSITATSLSIPEIQSLDLEEVIKQKTQEAFNVVQKPLLVDDVSLICHALGRLPGPFIKYFHQEIGNDQLTRIIATFSTNTATAQAMIGYHDGKTMHFFKGEIHGVIADQPKGTRGFGWDSIFIPEGYSMTRSEMTEVDYDLTSPRRIALDKLKLFIASQDY